MIRKAKHIFIITLKYKKKSNIVHGIWLNRENLGKLDVFHLLRNTNVLSTNLIFPLKEKMEKLKTI
jgi:hypothetical protein